MAAGSAEAQLAPNLKAKELNTHVDAYFDACTMRSTADVKGFVANAGPILDSIQWKLK